MTFWASSHWGNRFSLVAPTHSGQDINRHPAGTPIPLLRAGRLAAKGYDVSYGWWAAFDTGSKFDTYSHMQAKCALKLGTTYPAGTTVGRIGNTGRLSQGVHLHFAITNLPTPARRPTYDPLPIIKQVIGAAPAGNPGKPITLTPGDVMYIATNENNSNEAARRLLINGPIVRIISKAESLPYSKIGVPSTFVTRDEWLALYNAGLADMKLLGGGASQPVDLSALTKAISDGFKNLPAAVGLYVVNAIKQQWSK